MIMGLIVDPSVIRPNYWADRIRSEEIRVGLDVSVFLPPQTTATSRQIGFGVELEVEKLADFDSPSSFHMELVGEAEAEAEEEIPNRRAACSNADGKNKRGWKYGISSFAPINNLDDGCLMHIFSFLSPIPDRYNTALVCHRWHYLACHPRLWLRVDRSIKSLSDPGVFPTIESAVSAARPGDTILIGAGGKHLASDIKIQKPLCLIGGGELPDETTLVCSRGSDSALELFSTCKLANLTVRAELGSCLLHRSGRLTIDGCVLQCESNPLDYLSYPIVSTADGGRVVFPSSLPSNGNGVYVSRTRIEGGAKAVLTNGDLALQRVRVIYARTSIFFWFDVECQS